MIKPCHSYGKKSIFMKKAVYSDRSTVVEILTKSFNTNKSVIYAVGKREKRIERLMRYSFNICFSFGEIYLSDDNDACILFLDPCLVSEIWISHLPGNRALL